MLLRIFLFLVFFNFCKLCYAQRESQVLWTQKFSETQFSGAAEGIVLGKNGNVYSAGYGVFPYSVGRQASRNGFVTCQDVSSGSVKWTKTIGGNGEDKIESVIMATDGNLILAGYTNSRDGELSNQGGFSSNSVAWVLKIDTLGNILWQKTFQFGTGNNTIRSIVNAENGNLVFCAHVSTIYYSGDILIGKLDSAGNLVWQNRLQGNREDVPNAIKFHNNEIYFLGHTQSDTGDIKVKYSHWNDLVVMKMSTGGQIIWQNIFGGTDMELGVGIMFSGDGGLVVSSLSYSCDGDVPYTGYCGSFPKHFLFRLNPTTGDVVWRQAFMGYNGAVPMGLCKAEDGNILVGSNDARDNRYMIDKFDQQDGAMRNPYNVYYGEISDTGIPVSRNHEIFGPYHHVIPFITDKEGGYLVAGGGGYSNSNGEYYLTARVKAKLSLFLPEHDFCRGDTVKLIARNSSEPLPDDTKIYISITDNIRVWHLDTVDVTDTIRFKVPMHLSLNTNYTIRLGFNRNNIVQWNDPYFIMGPVIRTGGHILSGKDDPSPRIQFQQVIGKAPLQIKFRGYDSTYVLGSFLDDIQLEPKPGLNTYVIESITNACGYEGEVIGEILVEKSEYCTAREPNLSVYPTSSFFINDLEVRDKEGTVFSNLNSGFSSFGYSQSLIPFVLKKNREYEVRLNFSSARGDVIAWIDYNGDKVFSNSEILHQTITNGHLNHLKQSIFNFTIPAGVPSGNSRLRVRFLSHASDGLSGCQYVYDSEIEDYDIIIEDNEEPGIRLNDKQVVWCVGKELSIAAGTNATFSSQNKFRGLLRKFGTLQFTEIGSFDNLPFTINLPQDLQDGEYEFKIVSTHPVLESLTKKIIVNSVAKLALSGYDIIRKGTSTNTKVTIEGTPAFDYRLSGSNWAYYTNDKEVLINVMPYSSQHYYPEYVLNICGAGEISGEAYVEVRNELPAQLLDCYNFEGNMQNSLPFSKDNRIRNQGAKFFPSFGSGNLGLRLVSEDKNFVELQMGDYRSLPGPQAVSIWVKFDQELALENGDFVPIMHSERIRLGFVRDNNGFLLQFYDNNGLAGVQNIAVDNERVWYNIAFVNDDCGFRLYVNAEEKLSYSYRMESQMKWTFGKYEDWYYHGFMDELKYLEGTIDETVIAELYNNPSSCSLDSFRCRESDLLKTNIANGSYKLQVTDRIEALNHNGANSNVSFEAGKSVLLLPGFEVNNGAVFKADIRNCEN